MIFYYHAIRVFLRALIDSYALFLLRRSCPDYEITDMDWPRHGFRYKVRAYGFWAYGSGYGRTLLQATKRALKNKRVRGAPQRVEWSDLIDVV